MACGLEMIGPILSIVFQNSVHFNLLTHKQCQNEHVQVVIGVILTSLYELIFNTNKESDVKCVPKVRLSSLKLNQNFMSHIFVTRV